MATSVSGIYSHTPAETPIHPQSAHMHELRQQGQSVSEIATTLGIPKSQVLADLGLSSSTTATTVTPAAASPQAVPGTTSSPTSLSIKA